MNSMNMSLVKVKEKTRKALLIALKELSELDADFSGDNGIEYNWAKTNESGAESNADYCLEQVKNLPTDKEVIETFVKMWIENDNYYIDNILEVIYDENENAECIALALLSN